MSGDIDLKQLPNAASLENYTDRIEMLEHLADWILSGKKIYHMTDAWDFARDYRNKYPKVKSHE